MDNSFSSSGESQPPPLPPAQPLPPPPVISGPPPRSGRGRGWMVFAIILIVLLCLSIFGNFTQFISHHLPRFGSSFTPEVDQEAGPQLEEAILRDSSSDNKIAVIPVEGIISGHQPDESGNDMVEVIKAELEKAKKDHEVKAVILKIDSPGGEVLAADEIYRAVKKFQDGPGGKPVVCSMGSLAASGGYYISAPCQWIVANQFTLTASIGVIMETVNYRGLMDKIGVEPYVFKSGKYKDMLSPMRETNEIPSGEHAMMQSLIDETYQQFKGVVASGRKAAHEKNKLEGQPLADDWADYADGRVVSGAQALQLGLVDQLGDFDDAVDRTKKIANIQNARLVEYQENVDISQFLHMFGEAPSAPRDVKVDIGLNMPKLQAGAFYYLYMPTAD